MTIYLAGIPVQDEAVLALARLVDDPELAERLESAYGRETKMLALTISKRVTILTALEEAPPDLAQLRAVLLEEHVARMQTGL